MAAETCPIPAACDTCSARIGNTGRGYPWHWSVYQWLEGENAESRPVIEEEQAARDLAQFITALQRFDSRDWPAPSLPNSSRGLPLATRDASTRAAIAELSGILDTDTVTTAWEAALQTPLWQGRPILTHGDLLPGNLLVLQGRISAVIDFEGLGVGDPACDLIVAWSVL